MVTVSNTTPISELTKVDLLDLLPRIFGKVVIPQSVFNELQTGQHPAADYVQNLSWLEVVAVGDRQVVEELQKSFNLDLGESEAIALAEEIGASQLLIDEKAGRKVAMVRKLPLIGTVGVLLLAKRRGLLGGVKDVLNEMQVKGMRISNRLYEQVLTLAEEMEENNE